jgi:predicted CopG family antitoxin
MVHVVQGHKNIKVSRWTYEELSKLGTLQDSFDTVIRRLLQNKKVEQEVSHAK